MNRPLVVLTLALCLLSRAQGGTTNFLQVVKGYADAMLEHGRDTYGPQKSGLLLSALDRMTLKPLTGTDTLALGLVELHLHILGITAVRYPPNTIDR